MGQAATGEDEIQTGDVLDELDELQQDQPEPTKIWPVIATLAIVLVETIVLAVSARFTGSAILFAEAAQSLAGAGVEGSC
jgi:hypothetical protein